MRFKSHSQRKAVMAKLNFYIYYGIDKDIGPSVIKAKNPYDLVRKIYGKSLTLHEAGEFEGLVYKKIDPYKLLKHKKR